MGSSQNCTKMHPYVPHPYSMLWVPHEEFTEVTGPAHLHLSSVVLPSSLLSSNLVRRAAWYQPGLTVPERCDCTSGRHHCLAQVQLT